jgi:hypothetical protein
VSFHPYAVPRSGPRAGDQHKLIERSQREREAPRNGRAREEEHKKEDRR